MLQKKILLLLAIGFLLFLGESCKKKYIEEHYTGTFEFTDHYQWWQMYQPTYDTTVVNT